MSPALPADPRLIDSSYAAWRLLATLGLVTLGNSGMYVVSVVLPAVQAEFGVGRGDASLPYTMMMVALGLGGIVTGRLADRFGIMRVLWIGSTAVAAGYVLASSAGSIWAFALAHGLLLGLIGSSSTFAPLMADTALWWNKRRGIAVAICASGNYLAGSFWPPVVQWGIENWGWRTTYVWLGLFCGLGMALLSLAMRQRPPLVSVQSPGAATASGTDRPFGLSPAKAQGVLCIAGLSCCVAMAMPQVHIVAYCTDLGFGAARGAQMLSLMLACGIASRLISGLICDRIGGLRTLLLGSVLQGTALLMFLPFDGLVSLYLVSALFGLFQGGIVPSYAIIVREHFKPQEAGVRVGAVLMATMLGMALGGWMSGWVFDLTGSYRAAFLNGIAWNLLNLSIAVWLVMRTRTLSRPKS
ncbi:MAG: MFS transporter [Betaproteobacteria bacterium]|nr:MFS transporter [Betaproteobacteria bacterium]